MSFEITEHTPLVGSDISLSNCKSVVSTSLSFSTFHSSTKEVSSAKSQTSQKNHICFGWPILSWQSNVWTDANPKKSSDRILANDGNVDLQRARF